MLTADAEFRAVANVDVPALRQTRHVSRAVEARTRDDLAALQDLPQGQNQLGHSFPVPPTFDALSYFRLDFHLGDPIRQHNPLTAVTMLPPAPGLPPQPLSYSAPVALSPNATVVVASLRNYYAQYAPDSTESIAHIVMEPLPALTRDNDSSFYLHDVFVDTSTDLPTRIVYSGPDTGFALDYAIVDGHWVIDHLTYRRSLVAPLHIGQTTFTTEATYSGFSFPQTPQDVRLR